VNRGFTLLELVVVLAIMSMIAGVAIARLKEPYCIARLGDVTSRIEHLDLQARAYAERFARDVRLIYDLDKNTAYVESGDTGHQELFRLILPSGVLLDRMRTCDQQMENGRFALDLSAAGQSSSYAVRLSAGEGRCRWLFFAGVTGQVSEVAGQDDITKLFEMLRPPRHDAR